MNAHRVTDSSQDGFAVRLFRESNRDGFVRAFSDQPISFTTGFAKVYILLLSGINNHLTQKVLILQFHVMNQFIVPEFLKLE